MELFSYYYFLTTRNHRSNIYLLSFIRRITIKYGLMGKGVDKKNNFNQRWDLSSIIQL